MIQNSVQTIAIVNANKTISKLYLLLSIFFFISHYIYLHIDNPLLARSSAESIMFYLLTAEKYDTTFVYHSNVTFFLHIRV